jgi:hypothetical protein
MHRVNAVVTSSLVTPLRPKDYDIKTITRASNGIRQGPRAMLLRLHASSYFIDREMIHEAKEAYQDAVSIYHQSASDVPAELHTAFVFRSAYLKRDAAASRGWWDRMQAKKPTRFNADYWMAHSALHWMEGDRITADESWQKGNAMVRELPQVGAYEFDRHLFKLLRTAMDEPAPTAHAESDVTAENEALSQTGVDANAEARFRGYATAAQAL